MTGLPDLMGAADDLLDATLVLAQDSGAGVLMPLIGAASRMSDAPVPRRADSPAARRATARTAATVMRDVRGRLGRIPAKGKVLAKLKATVKALDAAIEAAGRVGETEV